MNRQILRLALPNIITNITIPLLGMVDMAVVGHMQGDTQYTQTDYLSAIAIGTMIFNLVYWLFGFLRMGTGGFTAQAYGARNLKETTAILLRSCILAFAIAIILIVMQHPIGWVAMQMVGSSDTIKSLALEYFFIRIWAAPATLGMYAIKGWFIGMQNSKTPMMIAIFINLINILCSLLLVFTLDMKIQGVAWGTVIAQYSGLLISGIFWWKCYRRLRKYAQWQYALHSGWKLFFGVNGNIFLRTLCLVAVTTYFTVASSNMPDPTLAVNTLLMQLFTLFSYLSDGFAYAGESLSGKFIGAKNHPSLRKSINYLFRWGAGISIIFTLLYWLFGELLLKLLTDNSSVLSAASAFMPWVLFIPLCGFAAFLWDGIYIGATASKAIRNTMLVSTGLFFAIYFSTTALGNHGLWLAFILYLFTRGIGLWILSNKNIYSLAKPSSQPLHKTWEYLSVPK